MMVRPLPGPGLAARAGDLLLVCAADGSTATDALVALVARVAESDGDGADLVLAAAGLLARESLPCAAAGPCDGGMAVLVCGSALAEVDSGPLLSGPDLSHLTVPGPVGSLRLALAGAGPADARTHLEAGVVAGAGLAAELAPPPHAVEPPTARSAVVMIDGVYCRNDHFNDPDLRYCQHCGISMAERTHVTRRGPRPPLGLLLLDDGSTFRLDSSYVVGREPDADPEVVSGRAKPLRVVPAGGGVSRVHLRIWLDGWQVWVADLGSTNGTHVLPPEATAPRRLASRGEVAIRPGTRISFGRRWLRYESHRAA